MSEPDGEYAASALRPYVITKGRSRPSRNTIGVETLLIAVDPPRDVPVSATREERALVRMCERLLSLVEAAAHLELPVSLVKVLASDLVDSGHLSARSGVPQAVLPDSQLLQEVLDGLRRLR
ncbi:MULTISPECIES: DUF742 domain-containing protein [Streptomyces]|uniref:DUF742 domain-containing protein n=2 Tax=Streptomyces scopuliridis TaxID=452529 RepID=A0A2T7TBF9_9ACTN|nr:MULTISPECIES: DUF742 domain-containing protein [Streptomyces]MCL7377849.1 DUF742 domain-containing protein [Streptomyces sp. 35G-GA-8]PVE12514.1 hypothetical protein Y717_32595 [Streptomyces scopuliridis RB72]WSB32024.1 DUF742 domain-containing protein [Streptomyces scopuliridis]WSB96285.1 DUF742 domain-containing protein [Streptomyces scopuliridis]WSC10010.1 DUF742 domain-containing protein [Streptomyces scopuliridis]